MPATKTYVPGANVRARQTQFGEVLSLGFKVDELIEFAKTNANQRGYLNLTISPRKNPTETATHSVYLDDYLNQKSQQAERPSQPRRQTVAPSVDNPPQATPPDDVPF